MSIGTRLTPEAMEPSQIGTAEGGTSNGTSVSINQNFLSTFVFEPICWIQRFGWRPLDAAESVALFHFWREVGTRMHIEDIPATGEEFERYNRDYETTHFRPNPGSQRVAAATTRMFAGWACCSTGWSRPSSPA